MINIGLLGEGMTRPRNPGGAIRVLTSLIAVAFSGFFVYVSFFGPPVAEAFKGTFMLGTAILCILIFRGRQSPLGERVKWMDEIFSLLSTAMLVALGALWLYWAVFDHTKLWEDFSGARTAVVALVGALLGAVLYFREATRGDPGEGLTLSDWLYLLTASGVMVWWYLNFEQLQYRVGNPVQTQLVILGGLLVVVSVEIARRVVGPLIPLIGLLFLLYSFQPIARMFPGLLYHDGFTTARVAEFLLLSSDGITGLIVEVFATYLVIFVVLGAFLEKTGLGSFFIDAILRLTGRYTGGPGLAAVVSSGLYGMISGSGVADVVTTGTFTIPLMKRVGYKPEFAGAVEAAASTGAGFMPPVMAGSAFLMAEFTSTSYLQIAKIAAIPAILYFISVFYMVYIRAVRLGLVGLPVAELPPWSRILPRLHFLLPIPAMVYYLVIGDSAFLAAFKTICLVLLLKVIDLLTTIRTPWSARTRRWFFGASLSFGLFAYFFGLRVGPPFSWFADTYRGLNLGDALFWTVACLIGLKLGEIIVAALVGGNSGLSRSKGGEEATESGPILFARLGESAVELARTTWRSLEKGAKNTLVVGCIAMVLGILLSSATQSDLPGRVSEVLVKFSFGLIPLSIFWIIVVAYVVGMGLPATPSYVVLVVFGVTALTKLGVPTLTAHFIALWLAMVSAVTPPVALAAYAASSIALSDPVKTGFQALRLASWIFVMPFLFVYTPILLTGPPLEIALVVIACLIGIIAWVGWMEGFFVRPTTTPVRLLLFVASALLLLPVDHLVVYVSPLEGDHHYSAYFLGAALVVTAFFLQWARGKNPPLPANAV